MRPTIRLLVPAALLAAAPFPPPAAAQRGPSAVGSWGCTHFAPGPSIGSMGYTMVMRFTLNADGTYRAGNANGRYAFDPVSGRVQFLDGELHTLYSDTQLRQDAKSGRPYIKTKIGRRYFTCGRH